MKRARKTRRPPGPPKLQHAAVVVFVLVCAAYLRSVDFDFTYDDHHHVVQNELVRDLGNLRELLPWRYFGREFPDQGRPLLVLSHFLDHALGGTAAVAHLQSTLWHGATALLVVLVAHALGFGVVPSAVCGLVFGLHPVNVEAVAGVSNREDVLCAFFVLLGLLAFRRALGGHLRSIALLALAYGAALASKENALAFPLLLGLVAATSLRHRERDRRAVIALGVALGLVTAGWAAFQLRLGYPSLLQGAGGGALEQARVAPPLPAVLVGFAPPGEERPRVRAPAAKVSLRDAPALEAFRAAQLIVGWPTAPEYEIAPLRTRLAFGVGLLALAALAVVLAIDRGRSRRLTLAIGWFFAATLPVAVPGMLLNPLADRYLYLPSIGFALGAGWLLAARLPHRLARPDAGGWAALGVGIVYFALTQANLSIWKNDVTLFSDAARWAPRSARVQQNLGGALLRQERFDEARVALERAVELEPALTAAHVNLGVLADQLGQRRIAIGHYQRAVEGPRVAGEKKLVERACIRLGALLLAEGDRGGVEQLIAREALAKDASGCAPTLRRRLEK